jgi:hypothetical protein
MQLEGLGKLKKLNDLIRTWTCNLSTCGTVPQPTILPPKVYTKSNFPNLSSAEQ